MTDDTVERMAIAIKAAVDLEGDKPLHEQADVSTDKGSLEFSRTIARAALSALSGQDTEGET